MYKQVQNNDLDTDSKMAELNSQKLDQSLHKWACLSYRLLRDIDYNTAVVVVLDHLREKFPSHSLCDDHDKMYVLSKLAIFFGCVFLRKKYATEETSTQFRQSVSLYFSLIAELLELKDINRRVKMRPVFYRNDLDSCKQIALPFWLKLLLPNQFYKNPTRFIESLPVVERTLDAFSYDIIGLATAPYDYTRVRRYKNFVFKRVDFTKASHGLFEMNQAKIIEQSLKKLGDGRVFTQCFLGIIHDHGNTYIVSKYIKGKSLYELLLSTEDHMPTAKVHDSQWIYENSEGCRMFDSIKEHLQNIHTDIEKRNVLVELKKNKSFLDTNSVKRITIIDFE